MKSIWSCRGENVFSMEYIIPVCLLLVSVFLPKKWQPIYLSIIIILYVALMIYIYSNVDCLEAAEQPEVKNDIYVQSIGN